MEKINKHNYEAWFLDYSEGNLSESEIVELNNFLSFNSELRVELEEFEAISLEDEPIRNESLKASLIREETTGLPREEYLMIAEVEGNISKVEKAELAKLVSSNSDLVEDLAIYHKTKLPKDETVVFTDKSDLIQKERKIIAWWTYASTVAAAAIIAFVFWNSTISNEEYSPRGFAWEPDQEVTEENLSNSIVTAKELELIEIVKKLPFSNRNTQFTQQNDQKTQFLGKKRRKREEPMVVKPLEQENLAEQPKEIPSQKETPETEVPVVFRGDEMSDAIAAVSPVQTKQEFVPIQKFAKEKIKKDLLKGKTFSETIAEEIADISNDKITFEVDEKKGSLFESFALNFGKLSISRNR